MGNPITDKIRIGTFGELLVQLRLLEHDVQAAPPIKDSGNDLIAVRGESFRGIQVKTTAGKRVDARNLPEHYHIIALVYLCADDKNVFLDKSRVFLIPRAVWEKNKGKVPSDLDTYTSSAAHIDSLFA
jgi:hypothetical protein